MQPNQAAMSHPPPMPPPQGAMQPNQAAMSHPPPMPPPQGAMQPNQAAMSHPPPMPPPQGAMPNRLPMLPYQPGQVETSFSPPMQMLPDLAAMPTLPQVLPTPFTTPIPPFQIVPASSGPAAVWCVRIPGDGSPIHYIMVRIVTNTVHPNLFAPDIFQWWSERDPTAKLMVFTLRTPVYSPEPCTEL